MLANDEHQIKDGSYLPLKMGWGAGRDRDRDRGSL